MVTAVTWQLGCIVLGTCCLSSGSREGRASRSSLAQKTHLWGHHREAGAGGARRGPPGSGRIRSGTVFCKAFVRVKIGNKSSDLWAHKNNVVKEMCFQTIQEGI